MSDLTHKIIADLKAELEQQRTRAEGAEAELHAEKHRGNTAWDDGYAKCADRAKAAEAKLAAARAHIAGVDWGELQALEVDLRRMEDPADSDFASLIAAAREVLS